MEYLKIAVSTEPRAAELLADSLAQITGGCQIDDPDLAGELFSPGASRWDYVDPRLLAGPQRQCAVCFYLAADEQGGQTLRRAAELLAEIKREDEAGFYGSLAVDVSPMENQDWQNSWKQYFKPVQIGGRLLVRPSWEPPQNLQGRIELVVDPSSSFGTGTHATTRMCLEWLDGLGLQGANMLDMGCGSGILACAALKLGASRAVCCDIEQSSMTATRENMERNGIETGRFSLVLGDILTETGAKKAVFEGASYRFITANIVADVLTAMSDGLCEMLETGGKIALSGIISERASEVRAVFCARGLALKEQSERDGWTLLVFEKVNP